VPTRVATHDFSHTGQTLEYGFDTPETAAPKDSCFRFDGTGGRSRRERRIAHKKNRCNCGEEGDDTFHITDTSEPAQRIFPKKIFLVIIPD
jgi:hypothetical protein